MSKTKLIVFFIFITILTLFFYWYFGPIGASSQKQIFIIPQNQKNFNIGKSLKEKNLIKNQQSFEFLMFFVKNKNFSGGYELSENMNIWQIFKKVTGRPDLAWVTVSGCVRKEQVGEMLKETLGWNQAKLNEWNSLYLEEDTEYYEGVYYPDTYLIPTDENPKEVSKRFINRFNEVFAPLVDDYIAANIKWTTGLKIASLIAREAAGKDDMRLISGIIWNRLDKEMPLQIDATMQYTLGKKSDGKWWGSVDIKEKQSDSPYNSYLYKGLPPTPICSPNINYIKAALNPEETSCLFYLHDAKKQIHCAETYKEHLNNIKKYL